jgi:hypothetical protein
MVEKGREACTFDSKLPQGQHLKQERIRITGQFVWIWMSSHIDGHYGRM